MKYNKPEIEILELDVIDVIQTSAGGDEVPGDDIFNPGGENELPGA